MGQSQILSPFYLVFVILLVLGCFAGVGLCSDYKELVFKGCASQKSQDETGVFSQNLETLFESLVSQSPAAKFYKTAAGGGQSSVAGLFQCRGDLSGADCSDCVQKTTDMSKKLCGDSIAGRVQLVGCYIRYEVSGFRQVGPTELLYKLCGSTQVSGSGFDDRVETALGEIAKGVESGGNGFYTGGYQSVFVLGQCEGDLGSGDCVNCVKNAAEKSKSSCGSAISAQIYLQQCYISYTYYPNGVPTKSFSDSSGTRHNTQKTVAIILGGLAGVGLVLACLLFTKSAFKKKTHSKYSYGG